MVLADFVEYALLILQSDQPLVMALVGVVISETMVIAGLVVMALVMVDLVVMPLVVVVMAGPVEMAKPAEYALVLPPVDVVVVLARYDSEQPKVVDQAVRYLVSAIEWYC
jgi:hypothetical protein